VAEPGAHWGGRRGKHRGIHHSTRWHEPTSLLPLRWGGYRFRYLAAVVLIVAGALLVQPASVYAGYFLGIGIAAHIVGWLLLPSKGGRRVIIALPSALCACALLIGSLGSVLLVICLLGWLFARQRPAIAYLVLAFPIISGVILSQLYPQYGDGAIVVAVSLVVLVGCAWLARVIASSREPDGAHS
jgi:hypothetical protein